MTVCPFTLTIWDKNLGRLGWVADPTEVTVTPRHMAIGTLALTLPGTHPMLSAVTTPGARITCDYKGEQIFSGPWRSLSGEGPMITSSVTINYEDDVRLLWRLMGYPDPTKPADDQLPKEDKRTGPAETVLKGFVSANKGRDPRPITVAATHGWGSNITVAIRMVPLADKLIDVVDKAGVGVTVRQTATGLLVDCYRPADYGRALTEPGGAVIGWSWTEAAPTNTAVIIGGPNEGTSREFKRVDDTGRRALWGDMIETFADAGSEEIASEIIAVGTKALADGDAVGGFKIEMGETETFFYGGTGGIHVGDLVTAEVGGQQRTDVLREVSLAWTRGEGFKVTPTVGADSDDPDRKLLGIVQQLAKGFRKVITR